MSAISGLIITFNEENNIHACIDSLRPVCDEIVVVDSYSIDNTVEIAKAAGAKVILQQFLGDGPQRSYGLQYCKYDWVLNIDADERLEEDAIDQIKRLNLADTPFEAFEFRRKNILHGKWIKVAGWYPDYVRRLFNKTHTDFSQVQMHTKIITKQSKKLNGHIIHYSFRDYSDMLTILNRYSTLKAMDLLEERKKVYIISPFTHAFFSFLKHFFIKRGCLAGLDGFVISALNSLGSFFKYAKVLEQNREEKKARH
ncbi:MAG: glycosyltransferase family 2 protein [Desulfobacterales bacterium]|nr:MAG: glycosyltransferase family 2 protein [Desulfobacterales bacterium]